MLTFTAVECDEMTRGEKNYQVWKGTKIVWAHWSVKRQLQFRQELPPLALLLEVLSRWESARHPPDWTEISRVKNPPWKVENRKIDLFQKTGLERVLACVRGHELKLKNLTTESCLILPPCVYQALNTDDLTIFYVSNHNNLYYAFDLVL